MKTSQPIFLVGPTRSGTTLLSLLLGHHPQIAFVGELEWMWDFPKATDDARGTAPALEPYHAFLRAHRHFIHHGLNIDPKLGFQELLQSFFEQMRSDVDPKRNRPHVVGQLHRHYAEALELWPEARFVHLLRDGRDVCASWIKLGWLGNTYAGAKEWRDAMIAHRELEKHVPNSRRFELRFEDLVTHPKRELERLCAFIGVGYDAQMLEYSKHTTYGPIDAKEAGKWRKSLSASQVRVFEALAGDELVRAGYAPSHRPKTLTRVEHALFAAENRVLHHLARVKSYGVSLWLSELLARRLNLGRLHALLRMRHNEVERAMLR